MGHLLAPKLLARGRQREAKSNCKHLGFPPTFCLYEPRRVKLTQLGEEGLKLPGIVAFLS